MAIELPALPYARDALEPHISAATLDLHHGAHHRAHVEEAARLLEGSGLAGLPLEEVVRRARGRLAEHAAQAWNHGFYWACLSPRGGGEPGDALAGLLARQYGDVSRFREEFTRMALGLFGSGWVWLVQRADGNPGIVATRGAATPLTGADTPLLACDVWEHAYYLDRQNRRAEYLEAFWKVVDWDAVAKRLR
ncbi:superoxide dismutase [Pseudoxanthomonas daejeonensis]|jgi:Fe-Mn family superoxide dismutase|uniref:Superoxide dismutase n=1 Tax=Pseudoxanthomonas daejeonensis TaxID=266062 RepID=A0ABQ6Z7B8_9GAMM|nr:Fe-Mn family superoxide dismutase [Pseudoxanthomonas daejeonensis]KAF1694734.1 superoxide dismutase [Pseudoxanthomonas daejeonensis]UNK56701.1 superoxide dismutase [Pseudoxanthomonas daejeonensis]